MWQKGAIAAIPSAEPARRVSHLVLSRGNVTTEADSPGIERSKSSSPRIARRNRCRPA